MENLQTVPFELGSQPWVAGSPLTFDFKNLPKTQGIALPHVMSIDIQVDLDPTYTTAPTIVGHNNSILNVSLNDGQREWFPQGGSLNVIRAFERLEIGRAYMPETVLGNATTNNRYIRRRITWAPPKIYGQPSDSAYNCAYLSSGGGKMVLTCGALTDISADCTAATGTVRVTANIARYYDKLIFPAFFPRQMSLLSSGMAISQKALYAIIGLVDSAAFGAFASGDVGNVTLNSDGDIWMLNGRSAALTGGHNADMQTGSIDAIAGDVLDATYDVNARQVNLTTPTALAAQALDLQAILWTPTDVRLTKLAFAQKQLIITTTGTNASQQLLGRFQPVSATERAAQLSTAMNNIGGRSVGPKGFGLRLASDKAEYSGPLRDFFPWQASLNKVAA